MGLQEDFLYNFFPLTKHYFLTGGNALNLFYFKHRLSDDLDCFTTDRNEFEDLKAMISDVCFKINASFAVERSFRDYKRYTVSRADETVIVDFVYDPVPQLYPVKNTIQGIRVDTPEKMTANKLCALLGRAEYKDLIDLYFLQKNGYPALEYLERASTKDGGINNAALAYVLDQIDLACMPDSFKGIVPYAELESFRTGLRDHLLKAALPK